MNTLDIKIITANMTKSRLHQMKVADNDVIRHGYALGHIVNVHKSGTIALIEYRDDYYYINLNWKKTDKAWIRSSFNKKNNYTQMKKFDTQEECDELWIKYEKIRVEALARHVYI